MLFSLCIVCNKVFRKALRIVWSESVYHNALSIWLNIIDLNTISKCDIMFKHKNITIKFKAVWSNLECNI